MNFIRRWLKAKKLEEENTWLRHRCAELERFRDLVQGLEAQLSGAKFAAQSLRDDLVAVCDAGLRYDHAIRQRAANGDVERLDPRGAIAEGADLDSLYDDWVAKMHSVAMVRKEPTT